MKPTYRLAAAAAALAILGGCAVVDHSVAKQNGRNHDVTVNERFEAAQLAPAAQRVRDSDGAYFNKRATSTKEEQLPPLFSQPFGVGQETRTTLKDVLNRAAVETGLRVTVAPDVKAEVEAFVIPGGFRYEGSYRGFLDQQISLANMSWKYRNGGVEIFRFDTQVFEVASVPGTTDMSASMTNRSGGNGSGASGNNTGSSSSISTGQDVKYQVKLEFWKSLQNDLKNLLSRDGKDAAFTVSEATNSVTVTATAATLATVETYIKRVNADRTRQVWLDIRVYTVDSTRGRDFGLAWSAAYKQAANDLGVTAVLPAPTDTSLGMLTAILGPNSTSRFANTKLMVNALSAIGQASLAAEHNGMVPSGEVVSVSRMREVAYLAEVQTSSAANVGTQTSLKPGTVSEGFALSALPVVHGGDTVMVKGHIDISSLDKLETASSGGQTIRTPQRTLQNLPLTVFLKTGQTYVYGLREVLTNVADSGITGTSLIDLLAGGQRHSNEGRKTIVITLTPYIINSASL